MKIAQISRKQHKSHESNKKYHEHNEYWGTSPCKILWPLKWTIEDFGQIDEYEYIDDIKVFQVQGCSYKIIQSGACWNASWTCFKHYFSSWNTTHTHTYTPTPTHQNTHIYIYIYIYIYPLVRVCVCVCVNVCDRVHVSNMYFFSLYLL